MHIAIDARELTGQRTGAGRYLDRLLYYWGVLEHARRHRFTLYAHAPIPDPARALDARIEVLPGRGGTTWEQVTLGAAIRRGRPDVLFAPAYTAPLLVRVPVALTVHDVSFVAHPEWFRPRERWRRRLLTEAAARRAEVVLTVSHFSREEIRRLLHVAASRIVVIRHGLGLLDDPENEDETRQSAAPRGQRPPTVLFVGSLLNRRHIPELVEAIAIVRRQLPETRLVLVGDNRTWPRQDPAALARKLGIASHVEVRAFVSEVELRRLYAEASVFAFLSEYEGFGLTPLEAMAAGVPPLVLETPAAREIYGNAAHFVAKPDSRDVAEALTTLLTDERSRTALLARAPLVLRRYRWVDAAAATLHAIEGAAG